MNGSDGHPPRRPSWGLPRAWESRGIASRGQALVEFTIVLPVLLVILFLAVDLGRAFYAWVTLNNAARVGATYAATHPLGWDAIPDPVDSQIQLEYVNVIQRETAGMDCVLDPAIPAPPLPLDTGSGALAVGSPLSTTVSCRFSPATPLVSGILGGALKITASAVFPIRAGVSGQNPVLPPCFPDAQIPNVTGDDPGTADEVLGFAGFSPLASGTLTTGPRNKVQYTEPAYGTCAARGSVVTYFFKQ